MKKTTMMGAAAFAAATAIATFAFGEPTKAVLTARQLGVEELDLDLDLDDPSADFEEDVGEAVEEAAEVAKPEAAEEDIQAVLDDGLDAVEDAAEEAVDELAGEAEAAEEAVEAAADEAAGEAEEAVDEVTEEAEEAVEKAEETVDEIAEEAEAAEEAVEEEAGEAVDEIVEEADEAEEAAEEAVADAGAEEPEDTVIDDILGGDEEIAGAVEEIEPEIADPAEETVEELPEEIAEEEPPLLVPEMKAASKSVGGAVGGFASVSGADDDEEVPVAGALSVYGDGAPASVPDDLAKDISEIETMERARRKVLTRHGEEKFQQAKDSMQVGNWERAIEQFNDALRFLPDKDNTHGMRNEASAGIGEAWYRIAQDQFDRRDWTEAEKSVLQARAHQHPKAAELLKKIREYQSNPPPPPPVQQVPRWSQESYAQAQADISARLRTAREYYGTGELGECRRVVELVLHDYPWCQEALTLLRRLEVEEHKFSDKERLTSREKMIADVTGAWSSKTYGVGYTTGGSEIGVSKGEDGGEGTTIRDISNEIRIREKMERIVIPEIEFRQANIVDVVGWLGDASRENDPDDVPVEERGVNFVLDIGLPASDAGSGASSDDPWGAVAETPAASEGGVPPLTIKSYNMKLSDTLDLITDMSGLKAQVKGNVVMIMPKNKASSDLILRMYNVLPSIDDRVAQIGSSRSGGSGDSSDPFTMDAGSVQGVTDWKEFFSKLGVSWPDESTVNYMPGINKLIVKNTAANLATLEQVLAELNVTPYQVEIEVRFVEVAQSDINSLGLEWQLNDDWEILENKADANLDPRSRRRVVMNGGNINRGFNYLNNNNRLGVANGEPVLDNIASFTSVLTNPELSLVLHALANRSNSDLLSAPKVVVQAGNEATIKTVTEYIYPTEYDVTWPEDSDSTVRLSDGSYGSMTLPAVEPENFNTREVGVILKTTPRVSPDGSRIALDLTPTVVSDPTWKDYGYTYPILGSEGFHLTMEQPFFPVRSLATSVEIYNGSTVVMGGMIREERYTEEDKIPILGDIPLIGHLFRYKYDQSDKKNLLIFVTARLVDPAGRDIKGSGTGLIGSSAPEAAF